MFFEQHAQNLNSPQINSAGWDLIGSQRVNVLSNRTGDVALLIVIAWIISFGN